MWPTKAYIYLYIVHLKHIYNSYSQRQRERERQIQTEKKSSKQYIMSNTVVLQLCSQRKNQQEGLLLETCELPTLTSRVWAHTNLFWWLIKFITISVVRSAQTICNKSDLNFTFGNDRVVICINITVVGLFFLRKGSAFKMIWKRLWLRQITVDETDRWGRSVLTACLVVHRFWGQKITKVCPLPADTEEHVENTHIRTEEK